MKDCVHEAQRRHAHIAALCCGKVTPRTDFVLLGDLFEDDNVYCVDISDEWPGPAVTLSIGIMPIERWPCLTRERAEKRAAWLVGEREENVGE